MKTRNCNQWRAQFDERLDERLVAVACAEFDRHVAVCPECGREWRLYAASWQALNRTEAIEPSVGFVEHTLRRLDETPSRAPVWGWHIAWHWAVAGAVALVLAGSGWIVWQRAQNARLAVVYSQIQQPADDYEVISGLDYLPVEETHL